MLLHVTHETVYTYDDPVPFGLQQIRQTARSGPGQQVSHWETTVDGGTEEVVFTDQYRNVVQLMSLTEGLQELRIRTYGVVETTDLNGVLGQSNETVPMWIFRRFTPLTSAGPGVRELAGDAGLASNGGSVDTLHELSARVLDAVEFRVGSSATATTADEALAAGAGVCQDHTHIFCAAARHSGWASRYVSGYLMLNESVQQDAGHAWAEVHVPGLGWVGFDVSNGVAPDDRYIRVAIGLDSAEAAPVSGLRYGAGGEQLDVSIAVQQQ